MGLLLSLLQLRHRRAYVTLSNIEPQLETGDVMLFSTTGPDDHLARLGSWHQSSQSGFLVRQQSGLEGLLFCHARLQEGPHVGTTHITSLSQFFEESPFDTVIIRKLCTPLNEAQKNRVELFANESEGVSYSGKVTVLMRRTDLPWGCALLTSRSIERFICSELVAKMLLDVDLVRRSRLNYVPIAAAKPFNGICRSTLLESSMVVKSS